MLINTIKTPTKIMKGLTGIYLDAQAPRGAANTPPMAKPRMICQFVMPSVMRKVAEADKVTKNSTAFTLPTVFRISLPLTIRFDATMGPQPPPPIASIKAPTNPSGIK